MKILFATKNDDKLKEIKAMFKDTGCLVVSQTEAGIDHDVVEDGLTFQDNSIKKATELMEISGMITLADDSGLEIDFLDKKPGVHSARYMGEKTPYGIKNAKILELMKDVPEEKRTARFVSVISAAFPDGRETITSEGTVEGIIAYEPKGENGFGYDPIFYVPEYGVTMAEMTMEAKNKISHRSLALAGMKRKLQEAGFFGPEGVGNENSSI